MLPHEKVCDVQTTVQWTDQSGRKRFQGNANLKTTQQYTWAFARRVLELVPRLRQEEKPVIPVVENQSILELFKSATFDESWDDHADLKDCIVYCRGSKRLQIPDGWRQWLPTSI